MIVQIHIPDLPWYEWVVVFTVACLVWGFCHEAGSDLYDLLYSRVVGRKRL